MPITRNQSHHLVMTVIYNELVDYNFGDGSFVRDAREMLVEYFQAPLEDIDPIVINTVVYALQKYGDIVAAYTPYLRNWKWERLPLLTQSILLMSYSHFYYAEKVDKKIVVNVAVDLAKKYIDDKQAKFINGILDGVLK